ncbi:MAG: hypothetical protein J5605_05830 [Bacteroidales bacterium]|nr:hypothetical protein [Bacteroidales bacterium]
MKKKNIIGACIALVALAVIFFLPLIKIGSTLSLFECFEEGFAAFAITWLVFPVLGIIANLFGKLKVLAAFLMLIPFVWGLSYLALPGGAPGVGVWIYGALTLALIIYAMATRKDKEKTK